MSDKLQRLCWASLAAGCQQESSPEDARRWVGSGDVWLRCRDAYSPRWNSSMRAPSSLGIASATGWKTSRADPPAAAASRARQPLLSSFDGRSESLVAVAEGRLDGGVQDLFHERLGQVGGAEAVGGLDGLAVD